MRGPPSDPTSTYLGYLPAVLQEGPLMGKLLLGFQAILTGYVPPPPGIDAVVGLEEQLDSISSYFDPALAPADFLPWLAQWVALTLRDDWSEDVRRDILASVVPLYHLRGTKAGVQHALELCLPRNNTVTITEPGTPPHYFQVQLLVTVKDDQLLQSTLRMIETVVAQQKPAHTFYSLLISYPSLVLTDTDEGDGSGIYVNKNTTLGSSDPKSP